MENKCTCGKKYCNHIPKSKVRQPINHESDKHAADVRKYLKKAAEFKRKYPVCKARILSVCTYHTTDVHHEEGREGELLLDDSKWLPVCRGCHDYIERHPSYAIKCGFSIPITHKK